MVWNPLSSTRSQRRGFTLVELLVVIGIIGLLVALLLPAVEATMESSRRNSCVNKARQLGLALQNHHDSWKRFPAITTSPNGSVGSATAATGAGYSWIVRLLPYMEEKLLHDSIVKYSNNLALPAFNATILHEGTKHAATASVKILHCPSFDGGYTASSALYSMPSSQVAGSTNYMAFAGTHVVSGAAPSNGGLGWNRMLRTSALTDGTSKTFVIAESKGAIPRLVVRRRQLLGLGR
jgi:prepilin-type N-terminal cleavage/methylation domain-containing protein